MLKCWSRSEIPTENKHTDWLGLLHTLRIEIDDQGALLEWWTAGGKKVLGENLSPGPFVINLTWSAQD